VKHEKAGFEIYKIVPSFADIPEVSDLKFNLPLLYVEIITVINARNSVPCEVKVNVLFLVLFPCYLTAL
jgi:hypothetical protein